MKIKHLLISAMCALSLSAFAEDGTLLFYEGFGTGGGGADYETYATDCKIGASFYIDAPTSIDGAWFNHGGRWDYPNNSEGSIWKPSGSTYFRFKLNTSQFPYAYLSLAPLYWGNYNVSYSFDGTLGSYEDFSRETFVRLIEPAPDSYCDGNFCLRNYWYDQYTENLGGKEEVYILVEYVSGNPLELDDVQIIGYQNEGDLNEMLSPLTKHALAAVIPHANMYYEKCESDDKGTFCPTELATLKSMTDAATIVDEKSEVPFDELYSTFAALHEAFLLLGDGRDDYNPDDDPNYNPTANPADYERRLEKFADFTEAQEAFYAAFDTAVDLDDKITKEYDGVLPETLVQEFDALFGEAGEIEDFCDTNYLNKMAEDMTSLSEALELAIEDYLEEQRKISTDNAAEEAFAIYPNPAVDQIRIAGIAGGSVYIFDAAGKQMLSIANYQGGAIDISSFPAGVYTAAYGRQSISFIKN